MILKTLISVFFCWNCAVVTAQYVHSPADFQRIAKESKLHYQIDSVASASINPLALPIVQPNWFAQEGANGVILERNVFLTNRKVKKYHNKGLKSFQKQKWNKSKDYLERALRESPHHAPSLKLLAATYSKLNNDQNAIYVLTDLIESNHIDFEAHASLAFIYSKSDSLLALKHITKAHLLNRNDTTILNLLKEIYTDNKVNYHEWDFNPKNDIQKSNDSVFISVENPLWESYAFCEAIWKYEEGYTDKMKTLSSQNMETIRLKECMMNALITMQDSIVYGDEIVLQTYDLALENNHETRFLEYEIFARKDPLRMSYLSSLEFDLFAEYLIKIRSLSAK